MTNSIKFLPLQNTRKSSIEWTNKTWNPTIGCTKYSTACRFCYAEKEHNRKIPNQKQPKYTTKFSVFKTHEESLTIPKEQYKKGDVVFVNSMSDLFHKDSPLDFIQKVFTAMNETPEVTYQVLTKRAGELLKHSKHLNWTDNIWMGVTVGCKKDIHKIEKLRQCGAKNKFLSIEPLVEELEDLNLDGIDWVLLGGESYMQTDRLDLKRSILGEMLKDKPRSERKSFIKSSLPKLTEEAERLIKEHGGIRDAIMAFHTDRRIQIKWVREIIKNCEDQEVPIFFKQWGMKAFNPDQNDPTLNKLHRYYGKGGSIVDGKIYRDNPVIDFKAPVINVFGKDHYIMDELGDLNTIWELKSYQIMPEGNLYNNLKEDIKVNGIIDPILYATLKNDVKLIIDGHTRLRIAKDLNISTDIPIEEVKVNFKSLDEIKFWMASHQNNRRNLSDTQKMASIIGFKKVIEDRFLEEKANRKPDQKPVRKSDVVAKMAGVKKKQAERFCAVMNYNNEKIFTDMLSGTLSIHAANKLVKDLKKAAKASSLEIGSDKKETEMVLISNDSCNKVDTETNNDIENLNEVQLKIASISRPNTAKISSIEEGKQKLHNGDIDAFIMVRDDQDVEKYLNNEGIIGFYISNTLNAKAS